jgi:hypothetical protein
VTVIYTMLAPHTSVISKVFKIQVVDQCVSIACPDTTCTGAAPLTYPWADPQSVSGSFGGFILPHSGCKVQYSYQLFDKMNL